MKDYESAGLGIALRVPESWVVQEADGSLYLASSQTALDEQALEGQAVVSISTSTTFDLNNTEDPIAIVNEFVSRFQGVGEGLEVTQEAAKTTIQGQTAAQAAFRGVVSGQQGAFTLTAIVQDGQVIVVFTVDGSDDNQYADLLEQVTASVRFK